MPAKPWGVRSIPEIDSRYPLWDQPNFMRDVDEGRFYLPDAEEGRRETIVTTAIDAQPVQCLRLPGIDLSSRLLAAVTTGGFFIFGTFHLWWLALASALSLALGVICYWLWTGTAAIPEKPEKDVGLGLKLPLYVSGPASVGWWAMFITMLADLTAFVCLVFGYFFYWTIHEDFPPDAAQGPGVFWPCLARWLAAGRVGIVTLLEAVEPCANRRTGFTLGLLAACGSGRCRRCGAYCRSLDDGARPDQSCLSRDCLGARHLDGGARRDRLDHATLLPGTSIGRPDDRAARHRHRQCDALLAFRRPHIGDDGGRDRRLSAGKMKSDRTSTRRKARACGC